jgi:hypothetical protein
MPLHLGFFTDHSKRELHMIFKPNRKAGEREGQHASSFYQIYFILFLFSLNYHPSHYISIKKIDFHFILYL